MRAIFLASMIVLSPVALAWDGYDYETGDYVEIEKGNLVRPGETIEFYDHNTGEYRSGGVQSIYGSGSHTEVEVYDNDKGEYRTFEMESD